VEKINDWVWEVDVDGVYTYASPRVLELLGYAPEEIVGKTPFDFMPPAEAERVRNAFEPIWLERKPLGLLENTLVRKDGRLVTVETSGMPVFAEDGSFQGYTGIDRDVTSRKQAEEALRESEERFRIMADGSPNPIWVTDAAGERIFANRQYLEYFGISAEEMKGGEWQPFIHPDDAPTYVSSFQSSLKERRSFFAEARVKRADGQWRWIESHAEPRFTGEGEFLGFVGITQDITDRKQAEEALRGWSTTLESRVAERTAELEHRARQLQKLTLELSETEERERKRLAELLHDDLQQVLAAAKFHLSRVDSATSGPGPLQEIVEQVKEMLKDAITKSRTLSHELSPAVLHHGDFAEALGWLAQQMQAKHGLAVRVEVLGEVKAQSDAVKAFVYRAAQELLFNVVKHAQVNEARIRIRCLGRYLCLSVSDRGRGFDPREIKETAGFGLLSIRERVALLGGRMKTESAKGRGTTFRIIVPDTEPSGTGPATQ
jgi:two-component system CheB/CheR fusion protein